MTDYEHKIIIQRSNKTTMKFNAAFPYIPHAGDRVIFPEDWRDGEFFSVEQVDHYPIERLIVIWVNK